MSDSCRCVGKFSLLVRICLALFLGSSAVDAASSQLFPQAAPESVGMEPTALELLTQRVRALVESDQIVGGEIHVVKNRSTLLHEAFGWKDRKTGQALEIDSIYCLRSLTPKISDISQLHANSAVLGPEDPRLARIPSAYLGGTGFWSKIWGPSSASVFSELPAPADLYATTTDYARLLALQIDQGLLVDPVRRNGSDGVHAWVWPEHDLIVLFFTQSLGEAPGLGIGRILETLLIDQNLNAPSLAERPFDTEEFEKIQGLYWDGGSEEAYFAVSSSAETLVLEQPGWGRLFFRPDHTPGRFLQEDNPRHWAEFRFDPEGRAEALRISLGGPPRHSPRHEPAPDLPHFSEVVESVREAHSIDLLAELETVRFSGILDVRKRDLRGRDLRKPEFDEENKQVAQATSQIVYLLNPDQERIDLRLKGWTETLLVGYGEQRFRISTSPGSVRGPQVITVLGDHPGRRLGDWNDHFQQVEVLKRTRIDSKSVLLVRVTPGDSPGETLFVEEESGLVIRRDAFTPLLNDHFGEKANGRHIGLRTDYEDFRDIDLMRLAFRRTMELTLLEKGRESESVQILTRFENAEVGVEIPKEVFLSFKTP